MNYHIVDEMADVETNSEGKIIAPKPAPVHTMNYDTHGSFGAGVYCTCGQYKVHGRGKVLVKWVNRHGAKTGHKWRGQV